MGLTKSSSGFSAVRGDGFFPKGTDNNTRTIALLGNPNVGKSSLFNKLTGMDQHTGNWPGKTVTAAVGRLKRTDKKVLIADLPGTYSLIADSAEEEVARNCIIFERPYLSLVVCDASLPHRGLPLALQAMEISERVILCFNLSDIAKKNGVTINTDLISERLGIPVICTCARSKKSISELTELICSDIPPLCRPDISYPSPLGEAVKALASHLDLNCLPSDFIAHRILEGDEALIAELTRRGMYKGDSRDFILAHRSRAASALGGDDACRDVEAIKDATVDAIMDYSNGVLDGAVILGNGAYGKRTRSIDRVLTGRLFGYPIMICLLLLTLWLTVVGANYPSAVLSSLFDTIGEHLSDLFETVGLPPWLYGLLVDGVYRVLSFIVSVMLPPMAIFFPLFTILEDVGYLPRIAYNLDRPFCKCGSCGKQALTMCMGLGCNAAGVVGCRIIDSPRERLLAVLTNSLVPCNGRFPTLIALITVFFAANGSTLLPALMLTALILLGVAATFAVTKLLSVTMFKGEGGTFALELPPFRPPQVGKVIVCSIFDRTLHVLGRAAAVAAPAGALIWLMANINVGELSLLGHTASILDPLGKAMGLDGVILMAFILGSPANEIVLPIAIMSYTASGAIVDAGDHLLIGSLLRSNGWTPTTAICFMIFSLFHWPCTTTVLTVKKETGSTKAALLSMVIPTALGAATCVLINLIF